MGTPILNAPHLRFPEFREKWEKVKVGKLLDFYPTNSLSWEQLEYADEGLFNLHYGLIHVGLPTCIDDSNRHLPVIKTGFVPNRYELCQDGDVAFADASEDTEDVAKCVEFSNIGKRRIICGLHTIHGRDNSCETVVGFKGYAFSSQSFHNQIKHLAQGTKIFSISTRNFDECWIGIPSKLEQDKIASLFKLLDQRIETQIGAIEDLKKLMSGITKAISISVGAKKLLLGDLLTERNEKNSKHYEVYSVAVNDGVVNQIEHLGRSFAAIDTSHYNVVHHGDIVYTKSPTGEFPYGIVKRSNIDDCVAVSPLYGVYIPKSDDLAIYLHHYFESPISANNYLHKLIQKGAKNTINITNQRFLENYVPIPTVSSLISYSKAMCVLESKLNLERKLLWSLRQQKSYLLKNMFV